MLEDLFVAKSTSLIGSYHHANVGDMALAHTLLLASRRLGVAPLPQLQNIHNLNLWQTKDYAVIGGGAVLTSQTIPLLLSKFSAMPERCYVLGVDCHIDEHLIAVNSGFFSSLGMLTLRNKCQIETIRSLDNSINIKFQPDICFALSRFLPLSSRLKVSEARLFGINIREGNASYQRIVRMYVNAAISQGYSVVHVPFSIGDDSAARLYLRGLDVSYRHYSPNVSSLLKLLDAFDLFFSTSFHAKILSYVLGTPCIPYFYAPKDYWLHDDLGLRDYLVRFHGIYEEDEDLSPAELDCLPCLATVLPSGLIHELGDMALAPIESTLNKIRLATRA